MGLFHGNNKGNESKTDPSKEQQALVVAFQTTSDAMDFKRMCTQNNYPGRLIAVPRAISAGCGYAWRAPVESEEFLLQAAKVHGCEYEVACILEGV